MSGRQAAPPEEGRRRFFLGSRWAFRLIFLLFPSLGGVGPTIPLPISHFPFALFLLSPSPPNALPSLGWCCLPPLSCGKCCFVRLLLRRSRCFPASFLEFGLPVNLHSPFLDGTPLILPSSVGLPIGLPCPSFFSFGLALFFFTSRSRIRPSL